MIVLKYIIFLLIIYIYSIKEKDILKESLTVLLFYLFFMVILDYHIMYLFIILSNLFLLKLLEKYKVKVNKSIVLINDGKINFSNICKNKLSLNEIIIEIKKSNIKNINEIERMILQNKNFYIIRKHYNPVPIIVDGNIDLKALSTINKDLSWLYNILKANKLKLDEIFYSFNLDKNTYFIKK